MSVYNVTRDKLGQTVKQSRRKVNRFKHDWLNFKLMMQFQISGEARDNSINHVR